jgi:NADH:ubiquinone oxidoreductase subunit 5 (subunit L)/multisubunit Na+/H+ antiporter MnhA subunit
LIHAATMVAAGVFLMARLGPLVTALPSMPPMPRVSVFPEIA